MLTKYEAKIGFFIKYLIVYTVAIIILLCYNIVEEELSLYYKKKKMLCENNTSTDQLYDEYNYSTLDFSKPKD